jgi:coenzyme F420-0:L-glutamate ligase/coenzyme F420-1:gamma-L-glutamate ligase
VGSGTADIGQLSVTLGADTPFELGRLTARLEAALWCEWLQGSVGSPSADGLTVEVAISGVHGPSHH